MAAPPDPPESWRAAARALLGEPALTRTDVAAQSDWTPDEARRVWHALGLPPVEEDDAEFTAYDVVVLRALHALMVERGTTFDVVLQVARVIGRSMGRVAEAVVTAVADGGDLDEPPRPPDEIARTMEQLGPAMEPFLAHVWRHHLLAALLRAIGAGTTAADGRVLAVGFADLVGFTNITRQIDAATLSAMVERFEALAYEQIVERGARVVKLIGDEVMFASEDPALAVDVGVALVAACHAEPSLPAVRVGIALGPTVAWEGDLFGPTVNLASRLVGLARPGTVLLSDELGTVLSPDAFGLTHLRATALKGFGRVRSWVARRADRGA